MFILKSCENSLSYPNQLINMLAENAAEVESLGTFNWKHKLKDPVGEWMFLGADFLPATDIFFIARTTYEHSRGGHTDDFLTGMDIEGNIYWLEHFRTFNFANYLINSTDESFWLICDFPDSKPYGQYPGYVGADLVSFGLTDGKERSRYYICFLPEMLDKEISQDILNFRKKYTFNGLNAKFVCVDDEIGILISVSNFAASNIPNLEPKFLNINLFLKNAFQNSEPGNAPPA